MGRLYDLVAIVSLISVVLVTGYGALSNVSRIRKARPIRARLSFERAGISLEDIEDYMEISDVTGDGLGDYVARVRGSDKSEVVPGYGANIKTR